MSVGFGVFFCGGRCLSQVFHFSPEVEQMDQYRPNCITGEPGEPGDQNRGLFVVIYGIILYSQLTVTNT